MDRGGNPRGSRAQPASRSSRGRGRGSSRGASNSSSKFRSNSPSPFPTGPRALQEVSTGSHGNHSNCRGRKFDPNFESRYSKFQGLNTPPTENTPSSYELERRENATKREQRGGHAGAVNGRGAPGGLQTNKQVRFDLANPPAANSKGGRPSKSPSPAPSSILAAKSTSSPFAMPAATAYNPFAAHAKTPTPNNAFGSPSPALGTFGAPSQPSTTANIFGQPSGMVAQSASEAPSGGFFGTPSNSLGTTSQPNSFFNGASTSDSSTSPPSTSPFTAPSAYQPSIFGGPSGTQNIAANSNIFAPLTLKPPTSPPNNGLFGVPSVPQPSVFGAPSGVRSSTTSTNLFGGPSSAQSPAFSTTPVGSPALSFASFGGSNTSDTSKPTPSAPKSSPFGDPSRSKAALSPSPFGNPTNAFGSISAGLSSPASTASNTRPTINSFGSALDKPLPATPSEPSAPSSALAKKIDQHLRKEGIAPPAWPTSTPGDPNQRSVMESFWQTYKKYQSKVRTSLIRGGLLDDPDKPKKLSEAIDFKGTCEEMCPELEKITRIVERDVLAPEKEVAPDQSLRPAIEKMVKANARSAAGQDAALPMDVRSPAALRRTLDYLFQNVLGDDENLPKVHGFLWDRTRAIRRDFVFQQSSMDATDFSHQVYCLERIARFHVIALHLMSHENVIAEGFDEQQEVEQLGKTLLSLMHAYEDCQAQGISCDNEAEFRAYYVLNNSHSPGILEVVQDWGWKFWGESDQVKIAVSLVETLQNIWDARGPLKPYSAADIALNGYSRFFSIITDKKVSYTMACFAERHFNNVRKAALKTILSSYRKQRDQTKDWTLTKLNVYLRFDNEEDIISFGEAYGLRFEEGDDETYLAFESDVISDPFPKLKQRHSYSLVERKRGGHLLPTVIDATVFDELDALEEASDEDSLFVKDTGRRTNNFPALPPPTMAIEEDFDDTASTPSFLTQPPKESASFQKRSSNFDHDAVHDTSGTNLSTPKPADILLPNQQRLPQNGASIFSKPPGQEATSMFAPTPQAPSFSWLNQPSTQPPGAVPQSPVSLDQHTAITDLPPTECPKSFLFGQPPAASNPRLEGSNAMFPPVSQAPTPPFSLGQHSVPTAPPSQDSKPLFSLGGYSVSPPNQQSSVEAAPGPSTHSPLSQLALSTGATLVSVQKPAFSDSSHPPIQHSQPVPGETLQGQNSRGEVRSFAPTQALGPLSRSSPRDNFTNWFINGDRGFLEQFTEAEVTQILRKAVTIHLQEETSRKRKEEEDRAKEEAVQFRYRWLATKYGKQWREAAHRIWMRRKGREARKARQEMAASFRASKALQSANLVEDFRASTTRGRRGSLESLLDATGVLDGVHDSNSEIRAIIQTEKAQPHNKRRWPDRSTESPNPALNGHKRGKSDNRLRRSLLSDPSYLQGGSRIDFLSKYDVKDETRRQVSGVQTDYFRLKARGIATLPSGRPFANSVAKDMLHHKRSFDGITRPATPKSSMLPPASQSVPPKPVVHPAVFRTNAERDEEIRILKTRAREQMAEDQESRHKKRTFVDDEDLFARAKRVREQMDEGSEWYRKEIEASRSVS